MLMLDPITLHLVELLVTCIQIIHHDPDLCAITELLIIGVVIDNNNKFFQMPFLNAELAIF